MGRASIISSRPPQIPIVVGSWLPIENSPPGIQTMPFGASTGGGVLFSIVGPNVPAVLCDASCATGAGSAAFCTAGDPERWPAVTAQAVNAATNRISPNQAMWEKDQVEGE